MPTSLRGWRASLACIGAAHRVHARVEDCVRTGKDTSMGKLLSHLFALSQAWMTAALIAATLLAWLRLLPLDGTHTLESRSATRLGGYRRPTTGRHG